LIGVGDQILTKTYSLSMSAIFYDEDEFKIDKQIQDINHQLDTIQANFKKEGANIAKAANVFHHYDLEVQQQTARILTQEPKWALIGAVAGTVVGVLVVSEIVQGARRLLTWIGNKMAQQDKEDAELKQSRRLHARDWNSD
jgi:uncharacterized DUF497 family protein